MLGKYKLSSEILFLEAPNISADDAWKYLIFLFVFNIALIKFKFILVIEFCFFNGFCHESCGKLSPAKLKIIDGLNFFKI